MQDQIPRNRPVLSLVEGSGQRFRFMTFGKVIAVAGLVLLASCGGGGGGIQTSGGTVDTPVGVVDVSPNVEAAISDPDAFVVTVGSTVSGVPSTPLGIVGVVATSNEVQLDAPWISQVPPGANTSLNAKDGTSISHPNNPYFSLDPYFWTNWNGTANCGIVTTLMAEAAIKGPQFQLNNINAEQQIKTADDWFADPLNKINTFNKNRNYSYSGDAISLTNIESYAKSHNLGASLITDNSPSLKGMHDELAKGRPVIALVWYQANSNAGDLMVIPTNTAVHHYMLVVGMDDKYIYVNDPGKPSWLELPTPGTNYGKKRKYEKGSFFNAWVKAGGVKGPQAISLYCDTCTSPLGIVTSSTLLGTSKVRNAFNATISSAGGIPPYIWSFMLPGTTSFVSSGVLDGLNLTQQGANVLIAGTPTTIGSYTFIARVTDSTGAIADSPISFSVSATTSSPLTITTPKQLPTGQIGAPYNFSLSASGGQGSYIWSNSGTLSNGLLLKADGSIVGKPTTGGEFNFAVQVSDSGVLQQTATKGFLLTVPCTLPQVMQNGQCVTPPSSCIAPQVLQNGQCVVPLPTCAPSQALMNGQCITPSLTCVAPQVIQNGLCVTPATIPSTPTGTSPGSTVSPASATTSTTVGLSWLPVSGATYYSLGVRDISNGVLVVNNSVSGTTYNANLAAGTQYRWSVASCNLAGCSSYTPVLYFQTPAAVPVPTTPTCTPPQVLTNGVCVAPTPTPCPVGQVIQNGQCTTPTSTPTCTTPQVLQNGACVTPTPAPAAQITVGPASLNFGNVTVGTCGSAIFAIQSVTGSASGTVSISPNPPFNIYLGSSFTVSNGSAANVSIKFCPTSASSYTGNAAVTSNATFTGVNSVALSGTGTPVVPPVTITTSSLLGGNVGSRYNGSLSASGGTPPYAWSLVPGTQLPQGLSLSSTGAISGTPITAGTTAFQIQVSDNSQPPKTTQKSLSIGIVGTPPGQLTMSALNECSAAIPQVRLTWTQASNVDYYQVYKDGSLLTSLTTTLPSYLDTLVAVGSAHAYFIRALNTGGTSDSNTANLNISCATPPGQFTLTAVTSCSGASPVNILHWTGAAGAALPYNIYRNGTLLTSQTLNDYSDTVVTPGASYTYLASASNSVGSTNSNSAPVSTTAACAVPVNPSITFMTPQTATVGGGAFTLTVNGSNFDSSSKILWGFSGGTPTTQLPTTLVNSTTLTATINQTSLSFSPFEWAGTYAIQVMNTATSATNGPRSNTMNFTVYNPIPTIGSVSGSCRANLNCTPVNGYDVRINGNGFVNNSTTSYVNSSFLQVNGVSANMNKIGQGPVYNQLQLMVNGSLIPTAGTYTINVCNEGTTQGRACASGSLSVAP